MRRIENIIMWITIILVVPAAVYGIYIHWTTMDVSMTHWERVALVYNTPVGYMFIAGFIIYGAWAFYKWINK